MKKMISIAALQLCVLLSLPQSTEGQAIATDVNCFVFPCSLPDVSTLEFGTARDNMANGLKSAGYPLSTQSRVGNPTGLEIRNVFEASDICVSSNLFLWRAQINPPAPYQAMHGNRLYGSVIMIGKDGQISLSRLEYRVVCDISLYNNSSSLAPLDYSVSRIGVLAGPDGVLFTPDDIIVKTGSGTTMVDAVVFIGGRVGSEVSDQTDIDNVSAAVSQLGPNGMKVIFEYHYVISLGNFVSHSFGVTIFPNGQIPQSFNRIVPFLSQNGVLFSVEGPAGSAPMILESSRAVVGPYSVVTGSAVEGTSAFAAFTRNPADDQAYFRLRSGSSSSALSLGGLQNFLHTASSGSGGMLASNPSTEAGQD